MIGLCLFEEHRDVFEHKMNAAGAQTCPFDAPEIQLRPGHGVPVNCQLTAIRARSSFPPLDENRGGILPEQPEGQAREVERLLPVKKDVLSTGIEKGHAASGVKGRIVFFGQEPHVLAPREAAVAEGERTRRPALTVEIIEGEHGRAACALSTHDSSGRCPRASA